MADDKMPPMIQDSELKKKNRIAQRKSRQRKQLLNALPESSTSGSTSTTGTRPNPDTAFAYEPSTRVGSWIESQPTQLGAPFTGPLSTAPLPSATADPSGQFDDLPDWLGQGSPPSHSVAGSQDVYTPSNSSALARDMDMLMDAGFTSTMQQESAATTATTNISSSQSLMQEPSLHRAIRKGNHEMVSLLLHHGASVDVSYQYGMTALHLAVLQNDQKIVQLLLEHQADCNVQDEDGRSPLDLAIDMSSVEIADLLLAYGTRVHE